MCVSRMRHSPRQSTGLVKVISSVNMVAFAFPDCDQHQADPASDGLFGNRGADKIWHLPTSPNFSNFFSFSTVATASISCTEKELPASYGVEGDHARTKQVRKDGEE